MSEDASWCQGFLDEAATLISSIVVLGVFARLLEYQAENESKKRERLLSQYSTKETQEDVSQCPIRRLSAIIVTYFLI